MDGSDVHAGAGMKTWSLLCYEVVMKFYKFDCITVHLWWCNNLGQEHRHRCSLLWVYSQIRYFKLCPPSFSILRAQSLPCLLGSRNAQPKEDWWSPVYNAELCVASKVHQSFDLRWLRYGYGEFKRKNSVHTNNSTYLSSWTERRLQWKSWNHRWMVSWDVDCGRSRTQNFWFSGEDNKKIQESWRTIYRKQKFELSQRRNAKLTLKKLHRSMLNRCFVATKSTAMHARLEVLKILKAFS